MQHAETKAKGATAFFDPFAPKRRAPMTGAYAPYFRPETALQAAARHVVEPARKPDPDRE